MLLLREGPLATCLSRNSGIRREQRSQGAAEDHIRRRCTPWLIVCSFSDLGLHWRVIHDSCKSIGERATSWRNCGILPFCTLRTPALISYKVRLAAASLKLARSMVGSGGDRQGVGDDLLQEQRLSSRGVDATLGIATR
jgi:hypothetical protein